MEGEAVVEAVVEVEVQVQVQVEVAAAGHSPLSPWSIMAAHVAATTPPGREPRMVGVA